MIEKEQQETQTEEKYSGLKFKQTLLLAKEKLRYADLSPVERSEVLIATSESLFPNMANTLQAQIQIDENRYKKIVTDVAESERLSMFLADLMIQLTENPPESVSSYDKPQNNNIVSYINHWPRAKKIGRLGYGIRKERLKTVLREHAQRYPDIPINLPVLGNVIGGISKQRVSQLYKELEKENQIPEGVKKLIPGYNRGTRVSK